MREDDRARVERQMTLAWQRLKKDESWSDWIEVGEGFLVGRDWAMQQAGTNRPEGKGYNLCFGEWMKRNKVDDMDKGDRSRLFQMMDNLPQIEDWRMNRLTISERLKLNHPATVWRKWKAFIEADKEKKPSPVAKRDEVIRELEERSIEDAKTIASLKDHIAELEAASEAAYGKSDSAVPAWHDVLNHIVTHLEAMPEDARHDAMNDLSHWVLSNVRFPPKGKKRGKGKAKKAKDPTPTAQDQAASLAAALAAKPKSKRLAFADVQWDWLEESSDVPGRSTHRVETPVGTYSINPSAALNGEFTHYALTFLPAGAHPEDLGTLNNYKSLDNAKKAATEHCEKQFELM